jgi:hypothetical protein
MLLEELRSPTGKVYLQISRPDRADWLHIDWLGYPTAANVQTGGLTYLDHLHQHGVHGVLNDNRHLVGRSLDWLREVWLPYSQQRGLRYFAYLSNPGVMAAASAAGMREQLGQQLEIDLFTDVTKAVKWLHSMAAKYAQRA